MKSSAEIELEIRQIEASPAAHLTASIRREREAHLRELRYRLQVRGTFESMSDEALAFQSSVIVGGIDREEVDREIARRKQ